MPSSLTYQMEFSQVAPVLLLFGILFIFSLVCIVDWYRSTNQVDGLSSYLHHSRKNIAYLPLSEDLMNLHGATEDEEEDFMCDSQPMASADNKEVERHFTTI